VRGWHSIALAKHFCVTVSQLEVLRGSGHHHLPFGRSSLIKRLRTKLRASHAIWPANMRITSTSLVDQINVA
jgi:hypothetical protein